MTFLHQITVLVLTWNEEANIGRTLEALRRFPRVLIVDSGSTDATATIAAGHPNVRLVTRPFDTHAAQWNHGLTACGIDTPWVLALDADYLLTAEGVEEIAALAPDDAVAAYRASFRYCVAGRPLSGSLYPPVSVLFRRDRARYVQEGHTQRLRADGEVRALRVPFWHDDRKPFSAWLSAQDRYAKLECAKLTTTPWSALRWQDRIRRGVVIAPWLVPLYGLTVGRGLLDGRRGLLYAMQRAIAETLLSARLLEHSLTRQP
jgi:glycosyltransferase involved in cell wall biosynthesis